MDRVFRFFYFSIFLLGLMSLSAWACGATPGQKTVVTPLKAREDTIDSIPFCGNGHIDPGEACDDGPQNGYGPCTPHCQLEQSATLAGCGNGHVDTQYGEQCDDGNQLDGDGCSSDCKVELKVWVPNQPVHLQPPSDPSDPSDPQTPQTPANPSNPTTPGQSGSDTQQGESGSSEGIGNSESSLPAVKGFNSAQGEGNSSSQAMAGGCSIASGRQGLSPLTLGLCLLPLFWTMARKGDTPERR